MQKSVLLELAENTKLAAKWNENTDTKFGANILYSKFKDPSDLNRLIFQSENNKIIKIIKDKTIKLTENSGIWIIDIKDKIEGKIFIKPIGNTWILFSENGNLLDFFDNNVIKYLPGISNAWISYNQMNKLIDKYANYGGIRAVAKAPSYKIPKRAKLTMDQKNKLPEWFFEDIKFTVMLWGPRTVFKSKEDLIFNRFKVSKEYLNRINSAELGAEFTNPGKSRLTLNRNASVKHIKEIPEATQKVFDSVLDYSTNWINKFKECLPVYTYLKDENGDILNIKKIKPRKIVEFDAFNNEDKMESSDLIKLQQMLTGGTQTDLVGIADFFKEDQFKINCIYRKFADDADVFAKIEDKKINIKITAGSVPGPFVINQIYKITSQFAWKISEPQIKNG